MAAVVVGLAVGGVAQIGRASRPYHRTLDLGYASLMSSLAGASNASGAQLRAVLTGWPALGRVGLFATLDGLASQVGDQERRALAFTPPWPSRGVDGLCHAALASRSKGVGDFRRALEGELGGPSGAAPADAGVTLAMLEQSAAELAQGDSSWAGCRSALRSLPGRSRLPASVWLTDGAAWTPAALNRLLIAVAHAPNLVAHHALALSTVTTEPAGLPGGGATVVPATASLTTHVVVVDAGNVDEPGVLVRVTLTPVGPGTPATQSAIVSLRAGRSVVVVLGPFGVHPGAAYTVQVSAAPPEGPGAATSSLGLQVATVPTTTTTTTTKPRTPRTTTTKPATTSTAAR